MINLINGLDFSVVAFLGILFAFASTCVAIAKFEKFLPRDMGRAYAHDGKFYGILPCLFEVQKAHGALALVRTEKGFPCAVTDVVLPRLNNAEPLGQGLQDRSCDMLLFQIIENLGYIHVSTTSSS